MWDIPPNLHPDKAALVVVVMGLTSLAIAIVKKNDLPRWLHISVVTVAAITLCTAAVLFTIGMIALEPPSREQPGPTALEPSPREQPGATGSEPPPREQPGAGGGSAVSAPPTVDRPRALVLETVPRDCPTCPEMVVIPSGRFQMGCVSGRNCSLVDEPVHEVEVASFALSKYEVTFEEYDRFATTTGRRLPSDRGWGRAGRPLINVSWHDAVAYAAWLSSETGRGYRLPSESEWEYSARAGTTTQYGWGQDIGSNRANCANCGSRWDNERTAPVGTFEANAWGLHDMHGNVSEWVEDCWHENYARAPRNGSAWTRGGDCGRRVLRGGSWDYPPVLLRSATRNGDPASNRNDRIGFRVARTLD